jgi:hypothetical protein
MLPRYGERKTVKKSAYGPPQLGHFAVEGDYSLTWDKCREQFSHKFIETVSGFYFCHPPNEGHKVAWFITKTEEIIGFCNYLHSYDPTLFCETDREDVIWIEPSRFWMRQEMRRQLFTILVRAGMNYEPTLNNYEDALWAKDKMGNTYAKETQLAVMRFLFGFTNYISDPAVAGYSNKTGWVNTFKDRDEQSVRRLLILPEGERPQYSVVGLGKLWT